MDELSVVVGVGTQLTGANGEKFLIRKATLEDHEALCLVCLQTGDGGKDATAQFRDPLLLGRRWVLPYVIYEPDLALCLVSLENNEVCGYALGCKDTIAFSKKLNDEYLPRMRELYPKAQEVADDHFKDAEVVNDFYSFELPPEKVHSLYPSHMHIDLVPRAQGQNLGRLVLGSLLHNLRENGAEMIHLEMWISNERAASFYRRCGFKKLQEVGTNVYLGLQAKGPQGKNEDEIMSFYEEEENLGSLIFAIKSHLLDWHESHLRTGEKYHESTARRALACFEKALQQNKKEDLRKDLIDNSVAWGNFRPICGSCSLLMEAVVDIQGRQHDASFVFKLCVMIISLLQAQVVTKATSWANLIEANPQLHELAASMNVKELSKSTTQATWWCERAQWEAVIHQAVTYDADPSHRLHSYPGYFRFFHSESESEVTLSLVLGALESMLG